MQPINNKMVELKQAQQSNVQAVKDEAAQAARAQVAARSNAESAFVAPPSPDKVPPAPLVPAQMAQLAAIRRLGPDHPGSKVAISQLESAGLHGPIQAAIDHYQAMQPVQQAIKTETYSNAAQNALDAAARRHQINLSASDMMPQTVAAGPTAQSAAVNEMIDKAARTSRLAAGLPPGASSAGSVPGGPPGVAPGVPPEGPPGAPIVAQGAPTTPLGHPLGSLGDALAQRALAAHDMPLSHGDLSSAITSLMGDGSLRPNTGAMLAETLNRGQPLNNVLGAHDAALGQILNRAVQLKGGPASTDAVPGVPEPGLNWRAQAGVPNGGENPVRNLYQWLSAAKTMQARMDRTADAANAQGHTSLGNFIEAIRTTSNIAEKQAMYKAFLKANPASAHVAAELGVQQLVDHGNKKTK